jgi:hypothetical protein
MKRDALFLLRAGGVLAATAALASPLRGAEPATGPAGSLESAFRSCLALGDDPLAGDLMRAIFDRQARDSFEASHADTVQALSIERGKAYATATATLKRGVSVAGVPVRSVYASTCELECGLAVWGLEFGRLAGAQQEALRAWAAAAPATPAGADGNIQVQFSTTPEGEALLVCDVSG